MLSYFINKEAYKTWILTNFIYPMSYKSVVNDPTGILQGGPEKDSLERGSVFVEIYSVLKVLMYFCNALASNCVKSSPEQGKIYCHKNYIRFGVGGSKSLVV